MVIGIAWNPQRTIRLRTRVRTERQLNAPLLDRICAGNASELGISVDLQVSANRADCLRAGRVRNENESGQLGRASRV